jgi:UDP-N-acetylglucosamine 2-epimerase (non-hydrolysing)
LAIPCSSFPRDNIGSFFGQALDAFDLKPFLNLDVMSPGQSLSRLTSALLLKLESYFEEHRPDLILAHGDTTTCFATAVSSFYHQIPFFHVEAGLRTHRLFSPFPEEFNRQTIAPIASHHFAPTDVEKENLLRDGVSASDITVTGSTVHEAVNLIRSRANVSQDLVLGQSRPVVVVTLHRRESAGSLQNVLQSVKTAALSRSDAVFICPIHPNPSVQEAFQSSLKGAENIILTEPLAYGPFISLLLRADLVVTDSGGVQEEAAFLGKKVLLVRSETERQDGLQSGLVQMVGLNPEYLQASIQQSLSSSSFGARSHPTSYQASASQMISEQVLKVVG